MRLIGLAMGLLVVVAACSPVGSPAGPAHEPAAVGDEGSVPLTETPPSGAASTPVGTPKSRFIEFSGDDTYQVGRDVQPRTYRTREPATGCYWARLKGFGGDLEDIIANDNAEGFAVVTIGKRDKGFETSGCPTWSSDLSRVTRSRTTIPEGTVIVGTDILAGTYRNSGGEGCYWARVRGFSGALSEIVANDNVNGRTLVTIKSTDKGFTSHGCGTWTRR
jgi:hypothetical protein